MIKKINKWLLLHWPMIWNTRALWVFLSLLLLKLLFYSIGRFSFHSFDDLRNYYGYFRYRDNTQLFLIYLLIAFLLLVLWFLYYFRHNPFKSFYPIGRWYLFKEFLIVFLLMTMLCSIYFCYTLGYSGSILKYSKNINIENDSKVINTATPFLPSNFEDYDIYNCCDSVKARSQRQHLADSIYSLSNSHQYECENYAQPENIEADTTRVPETYIEPVHKYSYLYYCTRKAYFDSIPDDYYIQQAQKWLHEKNIPAIKRSIVNLLNTCEHYGANNRINIDYWTNLCFKDSVHTVTNAFNDYEYYSGKLENTDLELSFVLNVMNVIEQVRNEPFISEPALFSILYFAVSLCFVVFLFRLTSLKIWLIAVIGTIFWVILVSLIVFQSHSENNLFYFLLTLFVVFVIASLLLIIKRTFKVIGGVLFLWSMFLLPSVIPIVFALIYSGTKEITECIDHKMVVTYAEPPIHLWINNHWYIINSLNLVFLVVIMFFYIIPISIKWQGNPEE